MKWLRRHKAAIAVTISIISTLLVYQNCALPADGKESASFQEFAYQAKADTIGYMSCSDMKGADPSMFFTFRVGAYKHGGMRLAEDFYKATSRMSTPQKMDFLTADEKNRDFQLQLALRIGTDMTAFEPTSGQRGEGVNFSSMFPPVNDEKLAKELVELAPGEMARDVPGGFDRINRFEGSLALLEVLEDSVRGVLQNGGFLALTYHPIDDTQNKTLALAPGDFSEEPSTQDFNKAYGVGYSITFAQGLNKNGNGTRVMSSVTETDLLTKRMNPGAQWLCPSRLRFKIVYDEDVGRLDDKEKRVVNCERVLDPDRRSWSSERERVRGVLRIQDWWVDMKNRCIIPKEGRSGQCYGVDKPNIAYNGACGGTADCVHFFSLCYQPSH